MKFLTQFLAKLFAKREAHSARYLCTCFVYNVNPTPAGSRWRTTT